LGTINDFVNLEDIKPLTEFFVENKTDLLFNPTGRILIDLKENEKMNENVLCKQCNEYYNEKSNDENSCGKHEGYLYLVNESENLYNSHYKKKMENVSDANVLKGIYNNFLQQRVKFNKEEAQHEIAMGMPEEQFKCSCWGKGLKEKGEVKAKHNPF